MEEQFLRSTRLQVLIGVEAFEDLRQLYAFEEVELTERGKEMLRNGEWNWETLNEYVLEKFAWLGDGILLDGSGLFMVELNPFYGRPILTLKTNFRHGWFGDHWFRDVLVIRALPETTQATQTAVCDQLLQVLTEYKIDKGTIHLASGRTFPDYLACPFSGPVLARFLREQSSHILEFKLEEFELDEDQCRALVTEEDVMRKDLEIILSSCRSTEAGERVLFDGIRRNRGPTSLDKCRFNAQPLAEALRRNTRIKTFKGRSDERITDDDFISLLRALAENVGIKTLGLSYRSINDESWDVMCQLLAKQTAIEHLGLDDTASHDESSRPIIAPGIHYMLMSEARKTHRTQSLVEMLKVNTTIREIDFNQRDSSIWQKQIEARLGINKFQLRVDAVRKAQDTLRAPLFGRAVHAVNDNDTFIFMMVTGNVDLLAELLPWTHERRSRNGK
jgi:hypothetical protein